MIMTTKNKLSIVAAAMSGLLAGSTNRAMAAAPVAPVANETGTSVVAASTHSAQAIAVRHAGARAMDATTAPADKHECKGKNDCKGKGGCKTGDNGCKAKNSCKGKGGCNTMDEPKK
jgi:hypothetical protein